MEYIKLIIKKKEKKERNVKGGTMMNGHNMLYSSVYLTEKAVFLAPNLCLDGINYVTEIGGALQTKWI